MLAPPVIPSHLGLAIRVSAEASPVPANRSSFICFANETCSDCAKPLSGQMSQLILQTEPDREQAVFERIGVRIELKFVEAAGLGMSRTGRLAPRWPSWLRPASAGQSPHCDCTPPRGLGEGAANPDRVVGTSCVLVPTTPYPVAVLRTGVRIATRDFSINRPV